MDPGKSYSQNDEFGWVLRKDQRKIRYKVQSVVYKNHQMMLQKQKQQNDWTIGSVDLFWISGASTSVPVQQNSL